MDTKKLYIWIGAGVVVAAIVIYLGVNGSLPFAPADTGGDAGAGAGVVAEEVKTAVPGTSGVTEGGQVVTKQGKPVRLDAAPSSPDAPQQSDPVTNAAVIPKEAVKLAMSLGGITPGRFEVNEGEPVMLSVTAADGFTHVFKFESAKLSAAAVGVGPGETRVITFNAPGKGEYAFFCDVPGHRGRGEIGAMVVK